MFMRQTLFELGGTALAVFFPHLFLLFSSQAHLSPKLQSHVWTFGSGKYPFFFLQLSLHCLFSMSGMASHSCIATCALTHLFQPLFYSFPPEIYQFFFCWLHPRSMCYLPELETCILFGLSASARSRNICIGPLIVLGAFGVVGKASFEIFFFCGWW